MRVLITGGAGFIGFHVACRLLENQQLVAIVDNFNDFYDPAIKRANVRDLQARGSLDTLEVDILDLPGLRKVFEKVQPEAVVHLAAWAGVRPSIQNPALYSQVNVTGTAHLLELAKEFRVEKFIFGSSSSVYGGNSKVPFSEEDPVDRPISPYAATKKAGELLCHTYAHNFNLKICCLRFFTVYGPRQRPEMAIHKFARLMSDRKPIPIYGDGRSLRDYTYVDDIVDGVTAALSLEAGFEIINLGESRTVSLLDLLSLLEQALGCKAALTYLPEQPGDMHTTYAEITRARRLLGYHPQIPIEEGIPRFARWFLQGRSPG